MRGRDDERGVILVKIEERHSLIREDEVHIKNFVKHLEKVEELYESAKILPTLS